MPLTGLLVRSLKPFLQPIAFLHTLLHQLLPSTHPPPATPRLALSGSDCPSTSNTSPYSASTCASRGSVLGPLSQGLRKTPHPARMRYVHGHLACP